MVDTNRYVYVMRHALAQSGAVDINRPLSQKGKKAVFNQIEKFEKVDGIRPDCLLCSSARRARQTAEILLNFFVGIPVFYYESLYLASRERVMELIHRTDNLFKRILIIGHNPGLEQFISLLDCLHQIQNLNPADCIALKVLISDWQQLKTGTGQIQKIFRADV